MFKSFLILMIASVLVLSLGLDTTVSALSGSDFQAGRIIDDSIFYNGSAIAPSDIQAFLNSKVPTCDTNGTQAYNGTTRAAYGTSKGYPPPYTCLKDFRQSTQATAAQSGLCNAISADNRSAAEIIYEVGNACGINQGVLLVLLEKEQSLVTDDWPWAVQYQSATGYACPDTAPCDTSYYGFFNQVYNAALQFKRYENNSSDYRYRAFRVNSIQYNPTASCGSSDVFVQNEATAGLYNYTPYQPNAAALANLFGTGDSCSSYGNRNFWRQYVEWFGNIYSDENVWQVIRTADDSKLYLQVGNTKRWIPTGDIYNDWGLENYPVTVVSDDTLNAIPTIPDLTRLGTNGQYDYVVDNGNKHYLPTKYLSLWNYQNTIPAPVSSLLRIMPEIEPMGRFIVDPSGNYWLMDDTTRHAIANSDLSAWGVSQPDVTTIQTPYLNTILVGIAVSRNIQYAGTSYAVDQGSLIRMPDATTAAAWQQSSYVGINSDTGSFEPQRTTAGFLVKASNSSAWYMLSDGKKYYILSGDIAQNWGMTPSSIITVSPDFLALFPTGDNLTDFAKDATTQMVYVLDGQKHYVTNGSVLSSLTPSTSFTAFSTNRLNAIASSSTYGQSLVQINGTSELWLLDNGMRYHFNSGDVYNAYNYTRSAPIGLASSLINDLPVGSGELTSIFKDVAGNHYLVDDGKKTAISATVSSDWQSSTNTVLSANLISLLPNSGQSTINTLYVRLAGATYYLNNGALTRISDSSLSSFTGSSGAFNLTNSSLKISSSQASYLIRSSDDQSVWFINLGTKTQLSFPQQVSLGYLSTTRQPTPASNAFLASFTNASSSPLLIRKQSSGGVKMVNFGQALGFPNSDTLVNTVSTANPVLLVDDATYDSFSVNGSMSKIVKDDAGKLYLMQNGQRRWITNSAAYQPYAGIPITYLYGTTMAQIPLGDPIN